MDRTSTRTRRNPRTITMTPSQVAAVAQAVAAHPNPTAVEVTPRPGGQVHVTVSGPRADDVRVWVNTNGAHGPVGG